MNLPLVLFSPYGIAHFRPKADNSWYHCNVQIKLVNGLAVATAAPNLDDLRAARWRGLTLSNSQAVSGPSFHDSWCRQDMGNSLAFLLFFPSCFSLDENSQRLYNATNIYQ